MTNKNIEFFEKLKRQKKFISMRDEIYKKHKFPIKINHINEIPSSTMSKIQLLHLMDNSFRIMLDVVDVVETLKLDRAWTLFLTDYFMFGREKDYPRIGKNGELVDVIKFAKLPKRKKTNKSNI